VKGVFEFELDKDRPIDEIVCLPIPLTRADSNIDIMTKAKALDLLKTKDAIISLI